MERQIDRCTRCILPQNYPGVSFNEDGVCRLCYTYRERDYLGWQALKIAIYSFLENQDYINRNYDCVLGLSGGRDSTYLLYNLVRVVGLRVLAYHADNGFVPEETERSLKRATEILNVDLHVARHDYLKKCLKHHILSWMKRPSAALVTMMCAGCRLGIRKGLSSAAIANKIPIVIYGGTPFEGGNYKTDLLRVDPHRRRGAPIRRSAGSLLAGYLRQVVRNPRWIMRPSCSAILLREFRYDYRFRRLLKKQGTLLVSPFHHYVRWQEDDVVRTITRELDWRSSAHASSTWRTDCYIALLKSHIYKSTLGFNDKDDHLSWLVRDGQISREEALDRVGTEQEIPKEVIEYVLAQLDIDYLDFETALKRAVSV